MRLLLFYLLLPLFLLFQTIPELKAENNISDQLPVIEVVLEEIEPGIEPFKSRFLLSDHYLRLDDGNDRGDFILFDRQTHEIHSFNHEDRSQLVMKSLKPLTLDFELDFTIDRKKLIDAPKVKGVVPVQHQFYADNKLCKTSVNVAGLLPELSAVLIQYEQAIVQQNKQTFSQIPASVRSSCYMANNYLYASDYLKPGFPLFVIDDQGRQKKLLNFHRITKHKSIMQPPEGYAVYYPNTSNINNQE